MQPDIHSFVKEALGRGIAKDEVKAALKKAAWQEDEIDAALGLYADVPGFPLPVPKRKPYLSAREAFMYLVLFMCLYLSAYNFGALIFNFVNTWLPDAARPYENSDLSGVRFAVSALIVAFPVYLWLSSLLNKAVLADPEKKGSKIRKWLTYITLFIAAAVIIGDLIALLFNLLGGELSLRFLLKVLTVLLIAGLIFGYYLWDLRKEENAR